MTNIDNLIRLAALVEEKLAAYRAAVGEYDAADYVGWRERSATAIAELISFFEQQEGARIKYRPPHDYAVTMAGIRSTSTGGWPSAFGNWLRAAENRIASHAGTVLHPADDPINLEGSGPMPITLRRTS